MVPSWLSIAAPRSPRGPHLSPSSSPKQATWIRRMSLLGPRDAWQFMNEWDTMGFSGLHPHSYMCHLLFPGPRSTKALIRRALQHNRYTSRLTLTQQVSGHGLRVDHAIANKERLVQIDASVLIPFPSSPPPPRQDTLTMSMTPKYYEQGEVIVQQGTPGNCLYVLAGKCFAIALEV